VPFWDYLEYLDRRIWNYSRAANMYYMRNTTQASQEILGDIIRRHVTSIQRFSRRGMENYLFIPLCKIFLGDKEKYEQIDLRFGVENAQVENIQLEGYLTAGIRYNYIPRSIYFKIMKKLGVDVDISEKEMEELEKQPLQPREKPQISPQQTPKGQVAPGQDKPAQTKDKSFTENQEHRMFFLKQCMDCGNPVEQSVVWEKEANGLVYYSWFCKDGTCLSDWIKKRESKGDKIISIKPVTGGKVDEEFASYYSGYEAVEAMPRHRLGIPTGYKFVGKLNGKLIDKDKITGEIEGNFIDTKHYYPDKNKIKKIKEGETE
jgi:hypothetical protein